MKTVLTIAGSDSGGGAGIQADIKTMMDNGVYGTCAVTALTAQNTRGVDGILPTPPAFLKRQIVSVCSDILPDAVKIGMICSVEQMEVIAACLKQFSLRQVVIDPVLISTSGTRLMEEQAIDFMRERLLGMARILTPNIPEAEVLLGKKIRSEGDMQTAAQLLAQQYGCGVLIKGGHRSDGADDVLYWRGKSFWYHGQRIDNPNNHGTGCTLSSAIASCLALGYEPPEAVERAKCYISRLLNAMLDLGGGNGPLHHGYGRNMDKFA